MAVNAYMEVVGPTATGNSNYVLALNNGFWSWVRSAFFKFQTDATVGTRNLFLQFLDPAGNLIWQNQPQLGVGPSGFGEFDLPGEGNTPAVWPVPILVPPFSKVQVTGFVGVGDSVLVPPILMLQAL